MIEFLEDNIYVRFGGQFLRQTVVIPMGTNCAPLLANLFLYSYENEFYINSLRRAKESLLKSSISHIVILITLSLSIIKDSINSSLISCPKNSPFLRLQNLLQLLLISIYFLLEMRTTTLPPNHMTNVMVWFPHCELFLYVKQYSISTSLRCLCISAHSLCPLLFKL